LTLLPPLAALLCTSCVNVHFCSPNLHLCDFLAPLGVFEAFIIKKVGQQRMPFSAPCPNDRYIAAKWEKLQLRRCVCLITVFAQNCSRERVNNRRTPRVSGFGD